MQTECSFSDADCINNFELEYAPDSVVAGLVEPSLNKIWFVYFENISVYTQFIRSIDTPPKIV